MLLEEYPVNSYVQKLCWRLKKGLEKDDILMDSRFNVCVCVHVYDEPRPEVREHGWKTKKAKFGGLHISEHNH